MITDYLSIDNIIAIAGLLLGGSGGAFFTWYWQRKKAKAEAKSAEAQAEQAKFEAMQANANLTKEIQDSYQRMTADLKANLDTQQEYNEEQKQYIAEIKEDRRHLRQERDELRNQVERLTKSVAEWKRDSDDRIRSLQMQVARNGRQIECMRPLLCGREGCLQRIPVTISPAGEIETSSSPASHDIEPQNDIDL